MDAKRKNNLMVPVISIALLLGMVVEGHVRSADGEGVEAYHARVRSLAEALPTKIGRWESREAVVTHPAVALLRPNVVISRLFTNRVTGEAVGLVLVQTRDLRDLIGHHPPVCYPALGWARQGREARPMPLAGVDAPAVVYRFRRDTLTQAEDISVHGTFIVPNGMFEPDVERARSAARRVGLRPYGAAQVQLVFPGAMSDRRCDEVAREILEPMGALVRTMLNPTRAGGKAQGRSTR